MPRLERPNNNLGTFEYRAGTDTTCVPLNYLLLNIEEFFQGISNISLVLPLDMFGITLRTLVSSGA